MVLYERDSGAVDQSEGRFLSGMGQAGHSTAHSPADVAEALSEL